MQHLRAKGRTNTGHVGSAQKASAPNCREVGFLWATSPDTHCLTDAQGQNDRGTAEGGRPGAQHAGGRAWPPAPRPEAPPARPGRRVEAARPAGSPAPRYGAGQAGRGGPRRSSPRSWAGRAAPERRCVRAGLGVRDRAPNPHAGRRARPLPSRGPRHRRPRSARGPSAGRECGARRGGGWPAPPRSGGGVGAPQPRSAPRPRTVASPSRPRRPPQSRPLQGGAGPNDGAPGQWRGGVAGAGSGRGLWELRRKSGQAARRAASSPRSAETLRLILRLGVCGTPCFFPGQRYPAAR